MFSATATETAMNISAGDFLSNGTQLGYTSAGHEEIHSEEGTLPHVFDLFTVRLILCLLYSLVFIICVPGNLAVVLVTALHRRMRNTTNFFLGHLAMANLCVGLFCIYQRLSSYLIETWIFGTFLCKMHYFTISLSQTASVLILVVTTVERYCVITHPLRSRYFLTFRQRQVIILIVWFSSAALSFHKFYYVTTMEHQLEQDGETEIICAMDVSKFNHKIADVVSFFLLFFLPLIAITVLCFKAALHLREQGRQWTVVSQENMELNLLQLDYALLGERQRTARVYPHREHPWRKLNQTTSFSSKASSGGIVITRVELRQRHLRVMKTLMAVALSFALCNLPYYLQKILQNHSSLYDSDNDWLELIPPVTFLMMCLNCAMNPFLHALLTRRFQKCLVQVVKCDRR